MVFWYTYSTRGASWNISPSNFAKQIVLSVFSHFMKLIHQNLLDTVPKLKNTEDSFVHKGDWKEINDVERKKIIGWVLTGAYKSKN